MAETAKKSPAELKSIKNGVFALSADDVYQNKPFHGVVSRLVNGQKSYMDYFPSDKRTTLSEFLSNKNISKGTFILDTKNDQGQNVSIEFHVDKNAEQTEVANPFLSNYNGGNSQNSENSGLSNALKTELETQLTRLRGNLEEADRKNRELLNDLEQARRELSKDNTEKMLSHEKKLREMEKDHEKEVRELEKQISDLKMEIKMKEMQYLHTDRSGWDRLFDFFEKNGGDFFGNILSQLQQANPGQPVTARQLQEATLQKMQENPPQTPENSENRQEQPATGNPQPGTPQQQPTQEQIEAVKKQVSDQLIDTALNVLTSENADFQKYSAYVRDQIAILRQNGIPLDAQTWVQMAKILAERAVEENITADRVAKVIKPALDGVKGYAWALQMMDPQTATDKLFERFGIEAKPTVRKLVSNVLQALKQSA